MLRSLFCFILLVFILSVLAVEDRRRTNECYVGHRLLCGVRRPRSAADIGMKPTSPGVAAIGSSERQPAALRLRLSVMQLNSGHREQLRTRSTSYTATIRYNKAGEFCFVVDCSHLLSLILRSESKLSSCWKLRRCNYWVRKWAGLTKSVVRVVVWLH